MVVKNIKDMSIFYQKNTLQSSQRFINLISQGIQADKVKLVLTKEVYFQPYAYDDTMLIVTLRFRRKDHGISEAYYLLFQNYKCNSFRRKNTSC